jgi:hypothetical protein
MVVVSSLAAVIICFMLFGHYLDAVEIQKHEALKKAPKSVPTSKPSPYPRMTAMFALTGLTNEVAFKATRFQRKKQTDGPVSFLKIVEDALPQVLSSKSFVSKYKHELKRHHRWVGVVFHFTKKFPRALRVLALASNMIIMLFIQSLTYNLMQGDDGSCALLKTEVTCLEPSSAFATGSSKCYWLPAGDDDSLATSGFCLFVEPDNDFTLIVFVAIFSAVISTPIAFTIDWAIQHVLAAPDHAYGKKGTRSVAPVEVINDQPLTSLVPSHARHKTRRKAAIRVMDEHLIFQTAHKDFGTLQNQLKIYRKQLEDTDEFDGKLYCFHNDMWQLTCYLLL